MIARRSNPNARLCSTLRAGLFACAAAIGLGVSSASAQLIKDRDEVDELRGVELREQLGAQAPLDSVFTDSNGETVRLSEYFGDGKPAILAMVYYECPIVCTLVLDKLIESLNQMDYFVGEDFRLIVVSFDHGESAVHAMDKRDEVLRWYTAAEGPEIDEGFLFHTGDPVNIERLADAVGFEFQPLSNGEYSHPVGLMVLSPEGKVSRYMFGFEYPPQQVRLSLMDATEGKIAKSLGDKIEFFCFRYDPSAGAYSRDAMLLMRIGGAITVVLLAVLIGSLLWGERRRRKQTATNDLSNDSNDRGADAAGIAATPAAQV